LLFDQVRELLGGICFIQAVADIESQVQIPSQQYAYIIHIKNTSPTAANSAAFAPVAADYVSDF